MEKGANFLKIRRNFFYFLFRFQSKYLLMRLNCRFTFASPLVSNQVSLQALKAELGAANFLRMAVGATAEKIHFVCLLKEFVRLLTAVEAL